MAKAQPTEVWASPLDLVQLSLLHFLIQVDVCTLVVPTRGLGELLEREGPPESWFSTFDQSASLIFVGFYGAGPVFEGGYVISAFRMALVVEKKVAFNILSS